MGMLGVRLWWILLFSQVERGGRLGYCDGKTGRGFLY